MHPSSFITTRAHTALSMREFLAKKCIPALLQAAYSPDFSPCDFYLFSILKSRANSYHFQIFDSVQKAVTNAINILTEADFQSCYELWKIRWAMCYASERCYFERTYLI
jgi:hypothetical protein